MSSLYFFYLQNVIFSSLQAIHSCSDTCILFIYLIFLHSVVSLPSGGPTEGSGGRAEAAGEENFRVGENEAARARGEKEGCRCSGETSEPVAEDAETHRC